MNNQSNPMNDMAQGALMGAALGAVVFRVGMALISLLIMIIFYSIILIGKGIGMARGLRA